MRTIRMTCDRCGSSQENTADLPYAQQLQIWRIEVRMGVEKVEYSARVTADWCRACVVTIGLLDSRGEVDKSTGATTPVPPPTLETLLRELIRDEMGEDR